MDTQGKLQNMQSKPENKEGPEGKVVCISVCVCVCVGSSRLKQTLLQIDVLVNGFVCNLRLTLRFTRQNYFSSGVVFQIGWKKTPHHEARLGVRRASRYYIDCILPLLPLSFLPARLPYQSLLFVHEESSS